MNEQYRNYSWGSAAQFSFALMDHESLDISLLNEEPFNKTALKNAKKAHAYQLLSAKFCSLPSRQPFSGSVAVWGIDVKRP